jgi:hypothetical protein
MDTCMVCGGGDIINGNECMRCGARLDPDGGGCSYDPESVRENIDHADETMRRQGFEWDEYDRDYRPRR